MSDGKAAGFRLFSVRPDGPFAKIGLQNSDVISAINGLEMTSPEKALEVYTKLKTREPPVGRPSNATVRRSPRTTTSDDQTNDSVRQWSAASDRGRRQPGARRRRDRTATPRSRVRPTGRTAPAGAPPRRRHRRRARRDAGPGRAPPLPAQKFPGPRCRWQAAQGGDAGARRRRRPPRHAAGGAGRRAAAHPSGVTGTSQLAGEKEFNSCKKFPAGKRIVKLNMKPDTELGDLDLVDLVDHLQAVPAARHHPGQQQEGHDHRARADHARGGVPAVPRRRSIRSA